MNKKQREYLQRLEDRRAILWVRTTGQDAEQTKGYVDAVREYNALSWAIDIVRRYHETLL